MANALALVLLTFDKLLLPVAEKRFQSYSNIVYLKKGCCCQKRNRDFDSGYRMHGSNEGYITVQNGLFSGCLLVGGRDITRWQVNVINNMIKI